MFLNNRYYDPTVGVFTSVDPLVGKTGTPYLYAGGSPVTFSDPSGLDRFANEQDDCRYGGRCAKYEACIMSSECAGDDLADAIDVTWSGLGGAVFAGIESADTGGERDGNWGKKSIEKAAAGGQNMRDVLRALGFPEDQIEFYAKLDQSVASRLLGHKSAYERIDKDIDHSIGGWISRNWLPALSLVLTVASIAGCIACAVISAGISTISAVQTCASGISSDCVTAAGIAAVSIASAGYAVQGNQFLKTASWAEDTGRYGYQSAALASASPLIATGNVLSIPSLTVDTMSVLADAERSQSSVSAVTFSVGRV